LLLQHEMLARVRFGSIALILAHPRHVPRCCGISGHFLGAALKIYPDQLRGEHDIGIVLGRILDLHEIIEAGILINAIGA